MSLLVPGKESSFHTSCGTPGAPSRDEAHFPPKSYLDGPREGEEEKGYSHNQL